MRVRDGEVEWGGAERGGGKRLDGWDEGEREEGWGKEEVKRRGEEGRRGEGKERGEVKTANQEEEVERGGAERR